RHVVLFEYDLAAVAAKPTPELPATMRRLSPEDVPAYVAYRDTEPDDIYKRLASGHVCLASWWEGKIVGNVWAQPGSVWIENLDRRLELPPDAVYFYDAWTVPQMRGRGLALVRAVVAAKELQGNGYSRGVAFVLPENKAALNAPVMLDYRRAGIAGYVRLGPWRWHFVRGPGIRGASFAAERA
ncbi:MAG TPA: hypothetical protein VFV03_08350, partial [Solirubrobacteraceae bacterium]|nr:hypothetical protein [Solirubrobacteraceae bacterium]